MKKEAFTMDMLNNHIDKVYGVDHSAKNEASTEDMLNNPEVN